jgi:hypothetical protein
MEECRYASEPSPGNKQTKTVTRLLAETLLEPGGPISTLRYGMEIATLGNLRWAKRQGDEGLQWTRSSRI